jgi:hypothetical protein
MLKHNQQVLQKERKTAISLLSNLETVLSIESESVKTPGNLSIPSISTASTPRSPPKIWQPGPTTPLSGRKTTSDIPTPRRPVAIETSSLPEPISNHCSLLDILPSPSLPPLPPPSTFVAISFAQNSSIPFGNSVPFSAHPSFAEGDEDEGLSEEDENQNQKEDEVEELREEKHETDEKEMSEMDGQEELHDKVEPLVEEITDGLVPKFQNTQGAPQSVMSKIWGMNPSDGDEVSDGEWDD